MFLLFALTHNRKRNPEVDKCIYMKKGKRNPCVYKDVIVCSLLKRKEGEPFGNHHTSRFLPQSQTRKIARFRHNMRTKEWRKPKAEEFSTLRTVACVQISFTRENAYFATVQSSLYNTPPPPPPPRLLCCLLHTRGSVGVFLVLLPWWSMEYIPKQSATQPEIKYYLVLLTHEELFGYNR